MNDYTGKWEKRWHPLKEQWVVYAAHRNNRPWSGKRHKQNTVKSDSYDPNCHLCASNQRISGNINPQYENVFVFDNDHPVVGMSAPVPINKSRHFYRTEAARGIARVLCYNPQHNISLSEMSGSEVRQVFDVLQSQTMEFIENENIKSVLIFENKGEAVGVSNPHPHCQIYATDFVFSNVHQELTVAEKYKSNSNKNIFESIINAELKDGTRIVASNEYAIAFIPFFARYAYEVMIFPRRRVQTIIDLTNDELHGLSDLFHEVIRRYDANFNMSFPYVMTIAQSPVDKGNYPEYHAYIHIQPPLRQPGLIKHLAGPEIGAGNFMADTMPEEKAAELKNITLVNPNSRS